ncbi:MAG: tRNA (N(6)-L-threonylcarbamoyladenosine(37)-C(2))-methylthiotransferase MtaB [Bacteroidota bacterium]
MAFHTLGCKLNYAETAALSNQFIERGFRVVEFGEPTDVFVLNTCTVTERADRECRQLVRRALRISPASCTIVVGCYAQLQAEEIAAIEGVDFVLGSREKFNLFEYVEGFQKQSSARVVRGLIHESTDFGPAFSSGSADRTRAFLKVQDGCDYHCSFCTIPLARGASRSQSVEATLEQARELVNRGYREIVLTGVNVGDYGRKIGTDLMCLLKQLDAVEALNRVRISSIEPNLVTQEMIRFISQSEKICHHFHIPLQSGSDFILRLMRRRYLTQYYRDLVYAIREEMPDAGIGADVIVGFPGETKSHFEETHRFLVDLPLSYLHVFTYSERPNTFAAALSGDVDPATRARRSEMLRVLSGKKRRQFLEAFVGRTVSVLLEGTVERGRRIGHTSHYALVGIPEHSAQENELVDVRITGVDDLLCVGFADEEVCTGLPDKSFVEEAA